jgi:hypothetical protein
MSFAPNDHFKIIRFLGLSIERADEIQSKLMTITTDDPALENEIKAVLAQLETVSTNLSAARNNINSSLIKADSLEWDAQKKFEPMLLQRQELKITLGTLLGFPLKITSSGTYTFFPGSGSQEMELW